MTRWWKHVALLAAWLVLGSVAKAQPGLPSPVGATRMAEPIRYTPQPQPDLVPGPMTPAMAPAGPPDTLNLPATHSGAFQVENYPTESAGYGSLGYLALRRQGLTHLPIAFTDNQSGGLDTGVTPKGIGTQGNGSFNPFQTNSNFLPPALNLHNIKPEWSSGGRLTVGYLFGNQAIELSGFYNPERSSDRIVANQGRLFVPFGPPNLTLIGFEGNNGLFNQADRVRVSFSNEIGNAEINYRRWDTGINATELIVGLRYFYSKERIDINTDDEFFTTSIFGERDPRRQANYSAITRNNLVALQFGGENSQPIPMESLGWIWLTAMVKGAVGPNFIERDLTLTRGDGFSGFHVNKNSVRISGLTEAAGFIDFHLLERVRFRAGYTAMYGINFSTAGAQVDYDQTNQGRRSTDHGNVFWHGPVAEFHFLF